MTRSQEPQSERPAESARALGLPTSHWETGSATVALHHRGVCAPHTGRPPSEALLLGLSGGIAFGYFSFAYEGFDPHVALLCRNTFDPYEKMTERLGASREVTKTGSAEKAKKNLTAALDQGETPLVWLDLYSLPYNGLPYSDEMWQVYPVVVLEFDPDGDRALIADRSARPLPLSATTLLAAWGRVKKERYRLETLDVPDTDRLSDGVRGGIAECIRLFFDGPEGGPTKRSFGRAGYDHWAQLLTKSGTRQSWQKVFPPGRPMLAGLVSSYGDVASPVGLRDGTAERSLFAEFLEEAGELLGTPAIREAAPAFRRSGEAFQTLGELLLPSRVEPFREAREVLDRRRQLFYDEGAAAEEGMSTAQRRLEELKAATDAEFPLDEAGVQELRGNLADQLATIRDLETAAFEALRDAVA